MEEPTEEKAAEAAEFLKAVYSGILEEEKPVCNGKYAVRETESGWSFRLLAGNNQVIGASEVYSGKAAMEKGIESVRKNAPIANLEDLTADPVVSAVNPKFEIYTDKAGEFRFRLKARNGEIILASEGYKTKASCENGIESVRKNAPAEIAE
ncbi:MAG: YegP family protein [Oscillospiraceae bacterium]|nr:YegP family protein [Oscillospiraceae bacterium]MBQ4643001.1 YegP family protein [Oscillospiraceae bacterium]